MRARLLDVGEVGAVRSQSLYHALAGGLEGTSDPVVLLCCPATPVVSIGARSQLAAEVDLVTCQREQIPVLRRADLGGVWIQDPHHLLLYLLIPLARLSELDQPPSSSPHLARLPALLLEALRAHGIEGALDGEGAVAVDGRRIGRCERQEMGAAAVALWDLDLAYDSRRQASTAPERGTSLPDEAPRPAPSPSLSPAAVAETLLATLERGLGLELVPSMPTPAEMEAVYHWDHRLLVAELGGPAGPEGAQPASPLM